MSLSSQSLLRREGGPPSRRPPAGGQGRLAPRHGRSRTRGPERAGAANSAPVPNRAPWHEFGTGLARYLPLSVLATASVAVLPAVLASWLVPASGIPGALAAVVCAVALSLLIAALEAQAWKRVHGARGVVFADLMLWKFVRRLWAERRLRQAGAAYRAAAGEEGVVRVELLEGLSHLLEIRNPYTYGHCRRVARHAEAIARAMHLPASEVAEIRTAALVHDVGKVYTPPEVLHKEGPLDDAEFAVIKRHSIDGADMLAPVRDRELASIVRHHHERLDGSGYPDGLEGDAIPLGSRIIAVADTFDAITSDRPYRRARSQRDALAVLAAEAGALLDADVVDAFIRSYSTRRSIASMSLSTAVSARIADTLQLLPGGLLGGASLAGVLPAVGVAGVLAAAPDARYERAAAAGARAPATALQATFPGALGAFTPATPGGGGASSGGAVRHVAGTAPLALRRVRGKPAPTRGGGVKDLGGSAAAPGAETPGSAPGSPSAPPSNGKIELHVGETPVSSEVPRKTPPVTVPPVEAPSVKVPPVSTPPVTTPSVTTPPVSAGPITVPSVTVPSATVQAPATPEVKLPGVHLPGH
jgi:putative nucleotidyltransferase with HDIG domain